MTDYPTWVSIVSNLAKTAGVEQDFETNQAIVSAAAEVWQQDKTAIKGMNRSQAEDHAEQTITIE